MNYRYQYDMNTPGTPMQLRVTSTRDLSLNVSVSNVNVMFQAYSSWYNLSRVDEAYKHTVESQPVFAQFLLNQMNFWFHEVLLA
jgi:hypothetical protein